MPGHKQKRALGELDQDLVVPDVVEHSPLWIVLMQRYAWGHMSASEVQQIAHAAIQSGAQGDDLEGLASIGGYGNSIGNAQRDLVRQVSAKILVPDPFVVTMPICHNLCKKTVPMEIMLPHDWVTALASNGYLEQLMGSKKAMDFWKLQNFKKNPQYVKCKSFFDTVDFTNDIVIPLLIHGDGAPYTDADSLQILSMKSLLSDLSIQFSQFLLSAFPKACLVEDSMGNLWSALTWSFRALASGMHPYEDQHGVAYSSMLRKTPEQERRHILAGQAIGAKAVIVSVSGDIEYFYQQFGWPYAMSNHPCPFCKCAKSAMSFFC